MCNKAVGRFVPRLSLTEAKTGGFGAALLLPQMKRAPLRIGALALSAGREGVIRARRVRRGSRTDRTGLQRCLDRTDLCSGSAVFDPLANGLVFITGGGGT